MTPDLGIRFRCLLSRYNRFSPCFLFLSFTFAVTLLPIFPPSAYSEESNLKTLKKPSYQIVIRVAERKLRLFEVDDQGGMNLLKEYDVATAIKGLKPQPMGSGRITKIEFNPHWYPPPITRETFKEKGVNLPVVVPPHHPLNFMGSFKIHLSHCTARGCFYRIHGNNDRSKIGKRVTGGCVRMYNEEGTALAKLVPLGTKVIFEP